jgi:hypothetical protein
MCLFAFAPVLQSMSFLQLLHETWWIDLGAAPPGEGKFIERCRLIPKPLTNRLPEDYLCSEFNRGGSLKGGPLVRDNWSVVPYPTEKWTPVGGGINVSGW